MLCWQCGAEVPSDTDTCPECDAPLDQQPSRVRKGELRCPWCGCKWEQEEEVCPACGASASGDSEEPDEQGW